MHGAIDLKKYALNDASWMNSIRLCSFVFNTRLDERASGERLANPMIVDVGVTNVHVPDLDETNDTMHFTLHRNQHMEKRLVITHSFCFVHNCILSILNTALQTRTDRRFR